MTEHDERERDEERPKVRVVDKRRFREGDAASGGGGRGGGGPPEPGGEPFPEPPAGAVPDELEQARTQAAEYLDHLQRLQAEFENYRKRTTRSQERLVQAEVQRFVH